jgi:hypothetical protein
MSLWNPPRILHRTLAFLTCKTEPRSETRHRHEKKPPTPDDSLGTARIAAARAAR